jgi:serine/threonine-protein kinase
MEVLQEMATGSEAPGAKPMAPIEHDDSSTPINDRVTASRDDALADAFTEGEEVDLDSKSRLSEPVIELRPSAEVIEVDVASDASEPEEQQGFDRPEPAGMRETDPERPLRMPGRGVTAESLEHSIPPVSMTDPRLGETLNGRYRLEKLIGKGGMGRVYRATQFPLNRPVALKILSPEFQKKDPQFVRRFYLEAATAARLTHPNTITVFDYGEAESGELFIVMEYLRGRPLSRAITAEAPFHFERTLHIGVQICRALREAHSKGIIHRDLKPGNIMLLEEGDDADFVKVLDFGLVKLFTPAKTPGEPITPHGSEEGELGELTRAGMFLGSPKYMSPEQIQGLPLDPRTDIYSLGVLMFQMCAGKPPFGGSTSVEVIYKHVNHPVPRIRELAPTAEIPEELENVIRQCLSKNRDQRFSSMAELLARLKDVRRLLTGASGASEIGVSLAELTDGASKVSVSHAAQHPGGHSTSPSPSTSQSLSVSISGSLKPHMRPVSTTSSSMSGPRPLIPTPQSGTHVPGKEAAFTDLPDDTPGPLVRAAPGSAQPGKLHRVAPIAAGAALVLVLGVAAYVLSSSPRGGKTEEPVETTAPAAPAESRVSFASTPEGAEVFEDGKSLGVTPFVSSFASGARSRRFVFKLEGFTDEVVEEKLEAASVKIQARMRVVENKKPPPGTDPEDTEYKDNPY